MVELKLATSNYPIGTAYVDSFCDFGETFLLSIQLSVSTMILAVHWNKLTHWILLCVFGGTDRKHVTLFAARNQCYSLVGEAQQSWYSLPGAENYSKCVACRIDTQTHNVR